MAILSGIHIYPIKSCRGISVHEWEADAFGLHFDRRWMLVTPRGQFLTQRELPALALVQVSISEPHLRVSAPGARELVLPLAPQGGRPVATAVWGHPLRVVAPDHKADEWFSNYLGHEVVLVHIPATVVREVDRTYAPRGGRTGFADGFPFLLTGEASLAALNARLEIPLPMNRFRPNLVVAGSAPFAEDEWRRITPCARCVVTTTNQDTGCREGDEPLRTLAAFRRQDNKVMFGQNVVHYGTGKLRVGDAVSEG
jgi:uncharacterized protein YcbX